MTVSHNVVMSGAGLGLEFGDNVWCSEKKSYPTTTISCDFNVNFSNPFSLKKNYQKRFLKSQLKAHKKPFPICTFTVNIKRIVKRR